MESKPISKELTDSLMDCAEMFGQNPDLCADPRAWQHLLVYNKPSISRDQVAWLMNAIQRHERYPGDPRISRRSDMADYALLYEIMEVMGVRFDDEDARFNGSPPDVRRPLRNNSGIFSADQPPQGGE